MIEQDNINRRISERFDKKGYIKVVIAKSQNPSIVGREFRCKTSDISSGGLQMVVHTDIPVGTIVTLQVVFSDPPATFDHSASVAWSKENNEDIIKTYSIGIGFTSTMSASEHKWKDMINSRMRGSQS